MRRIARAIALCAVSLLIGCAAHEAVKVVVPGSAPCPVAEPVKAKPVKLIGGNCLVMGVDVKGKPSKLVCKTADGDTSIWVRSPEEEQVKQ